MFLVKRPKFSSLRSWFVGMCIKFAVFVYQCKRFWDCFDLFHFVLKRVYRIAGFYFLRQAIPPSNCSWQMGGGDNTNSFLLRVSEDH